MKQIYCGLIVANARNYCDSWIDYSLITFKLKFYMPYIIHVDAIIITFRTVNNS